MNDSVIDSSLKGKVNTDQELLNDMYNIVLEVLFSQNRARLCLQGRMLTLFTLLFMEKTV